MGTYEGGDHADDEGLTPVQRRKLSIELAGKRAALAETGAWTDLLRLYVRDLLSREVFAPVAEEHNTEGGHDACLRQDGLL